MSSHIPTLFLAIITAITNYITEHDQASNVPTTVYNPINQDVFLQNKKSSAWKQYISPYTLPPYSYSRQKTIHNVSTQFSPLQLKKWKLDNS